MELQEQKSNIVQFTPKRGSPASLALTFINIAKEQGIKPAHQWAAENIPLNIWGRVQHWVATYNKIYSSGGEAEHG